MQDYQESAKGIFIKAGGFALIILFLVFSVHTSLSERNRVYDETIEELETKCYVLKGIVESPAVIIYVENFDSFIDKVEELNAEYVYYHLENFYVFNEYYTIAYRYVLAYEGHGFLKLRRAN